MKNPFLLAALLGGLAIARSVCTHALADEPQPASFGPGSLWDWHFVGDPRISPDGQRIVYVHSRVDRERDDYDHDLWILDPDGDPRPLTGGSHDDRSPRWSAQGQQLAFISSRSGQRQVYILDLRGGEPWQLTADTDGVRGFAWSPDGRRIAFTSRTTMPGEPGHEPAGARKPSRAPRAVVTDRLIYRNDGTPGYRGAKRSHIWVVDTDQGPRRNARRVTHGGYDDGEPVWSADGRYLLFNSVRREDVDYFAGDSEIYVVPADGSSEPRALTARTGPDDDPLPSPDGRWIAFSGYDETTPPQSSYVSGLYVMRSDGTGLRRLAADFDRNVPDTMMTDVAAPRVGGDRMGGRPKAIKSLACNN